MGPLNDDGQRARMKTTKPRLRPTGEPWGRLVSLNGPAKTIDLTKDVYVIGRGPGVDIQLEDCALCSKEHCRLFVVKKPDTSVNGTVVNGRKIQSRKIPLTHRSEIEIKFDRLFVFHNLLEADPDERHITTPYYVFETQTLGRGSFSIGKAQILIMKKTIGTKPERLSKVRLAVDTRTGERVACKIIDKSKVKGPKGIEDGWCPDHTINREIEILKRIRHPNIVSIKDVIQSDSDVYIFLTRVMGGEVFDYILDSQPTGIPEHEAVNFVRNEVLARSQYHAPRLEARKYSPRSSQTFQQ
ncbi:Checkpoint kinase 2, partial [Borealophlyctis nickersoniae]